MATTEDSLQLRWHDPCANAYGGVHSPFLDHPPPENVTTLSVTTKGTTPMHEPLPMGSPVNRTETNRPAVVTGPAYARFAWMTCYEEWGSVQEVCRTFGISRKTFYKWLKRYRQSGGDTTSLRDQSRRPHTFPRATPESSVLLLKEARQTTGFGQRRLKTYLQEKHNISLSERTIWKILKRLEHPRHPVNRAGLA